MVISEKNKILITRVIDTINWPLIHKFYKLVGRTIGTETIQISGIKKLDKKIKLNEDHIKDEVLHIINHVVENDISQYMYGPWNVIWVNGEWEMEIPETDDKGNEILDGDSAVISREIVVDEDDLEDKTDTIDLNKQLEKALSDENYELASKIRDLIDIYKKQK